MRTVTPRPGSHGIPSLPEILHLPPVATRLPPPGRTVIPPGICHRLSENSSSLFERGLRGKNKEGSVKSALKSPHDASAGRVPGQFPQRVKRGRKGSRRTDVKLSLQCPKELAATRHKITKTLVQDSADLVPSFTGYCSSVHLFSSDSIFFLYFHSSTIHFSILRVSALKFTPILKSFRLSEAKGSA